MPYLNDNSNSTSATNKPFATLFHNLNIVLGPSSGLDSAEVDPQDISRLMENYNSNPEEWRPYALHDVNKAYTRNLVDEGNGKSNLLILVWSPGKGSAIHDHADAHCVMKVLQGSLEETLYTWPDQAKLQAGQASPPEIKRVTVYGENDVAYMSDRLGLHKISNPDPDNVSVSLHLYTPPNAANYGFSIFDEETGKAKHIKQTYFYSVRGVRC